MEALSALQSLHNYDEDFSKSLKTYHILLKISLSYLEKKQGIDAADAAEEIVSALKIKNDTIEQANYWTLVQILKMPHDEITHHLKVCEKTLEMTEPTKFAFITYLSARDLAVKTNKPKIRVQIVNGRIREVKAKTNTINWKTLLRWAGILPIAALALIAGYLISSYTIWFFYKIAYNASEPNYFIMITMPLFRGIIGGFAFIWAGNLTAPKYHKKVNTILHRVICVFMIFMLAAIIYHYSQWPILNGATVAGEIVEPIFIIAGSTFGYFNMKKRYSDYF